MRFSVRGGIVVALLSSVPGACSAPAPRAPAPLESVEPRPAPTLPAWVVSISPRDEAKAGSQIRVIFRDDVVPLASLDDPARQTALAHVSISPALPGRFLFLTPKMLEFEADAPLPPATRVLVTLHEGLSDTKGHQLAGDLAWAFETPQLTITTDLPGAAASPALPGAAASPTGPGASASPTGPGALKTTGLLPTIVVTSNAELADDALLAHARIVSRDDPGATPIALVRKAEPSPSPTAIGEAPGGESEPQFVYALQPARELDRATRYRFEVTPGLATRRGNLTLATAAVGFFETYRPLALVGVSGAGRPDGDGAAGRFANGTPLLAFTTALDPASAPGAIVVSPSPLPGVPLYRVSEGDTTIALDPSALRPQTSYAISVAPTLRDAYGQTLGTQAKATFATGRLAGDLWAPAGFNIFPAASDLALDVSATNVRDGAYRQTFRKLQPADLATLDPSDGTALEKFFGPREGWPSVSSPPADRARTTAVALRERLGGFAGLLAYGIAARTNAFVDANGNPAVAEKRVFGAVQLTDVGLFAQWFPDAGFVRANRLSDGSPIAGARVAIEPIADRSDASAPHVSSASPEPCATGVTDATGTLVLDATAFAGCRATSPAADRAPSLLVVVRDGDDWAFVRTNDGSGAYAYGIYAGWSAGTPISHGAIVSDRDLYQPGETAYFTGIGYFDTDGTLARGRAASYRVTVRDPSGSETSLGTVSLDAFGAFALAMPVGRRAAVGYYTIEAKASDGEDLVGSYRVAEFKPANFKVALALDRAWATPGENVAAAWSSTYLFGSTVDGGRTHLDVTRARAYVSPHGWDAFAFGRQWSYPEEEPVLSSDVLQADAAVGADGKSARAIAVANDLPYAATYRVDAETTDVSNLSVTDSKTFVAYPSRELIGLRASFVASAGKASDVAVIVTDPDGRAIAGKRVRVTLQKRAYATATQLVAGGETPTAAVRYDDVAGTEVTSAAKPQSVALAPETAGSYRIRANFVDAASDVTASDTDLWVAGPGEAAWANASDRALVVKLDKTSYRPGETATALVQSPYPQADLFFAIVRHGVIERRVVRVSGAAPSVRFTVTADMLPNAAVEAVLVRRGTALRRGVPAGLATLARIGFQPFGVALDAKYLKITVKPRFARATPQQMQHVAVHVADSSGRGLRAELAVAVVNEAVLQLGGYRFPDLVRTVYAEQPISTRFADNRDDVKLQSPAAPLEKGFGYGGGFEAGAAGTRVRTRFQPNAFFDGHVVTDSAGNANVAFAVPDDLTTWRVMVMAMTPDARFGNADETFVATKPLVTNAILPQFARPGDSLRAGLSVTDTRRGGGDVAIDARLSGDLRFADAAASPSPRETSLRAPIDRLVQAFRFPIAVTGTRAASVAFATRLGTERDAFAVPLEIRTNDVFETVVQTGTTEGAIEIPFSADASAPRDAGGLDIMLASTLLPETREAVRLASSGDGLPFAISIASRIGVAADAIVLERRYGRTTELATLETVLAKNLDALRGLALADGGYAPWPSAAAADIYSTSFAAVGLARARAAGANVDADVARVRTFLLARLADPKLGPPDDGIERIHARLEALETLGILGDMRDDRLPELYDAREKLGYYEQLELARHMLRLPRWTAAGRAYANELLERVHLTARAAAVNVPGQSLESATAGQAQLVGLLVDMHADAATVDRALGSLLSLRDRSGVWPCASDDMEAMDAVVAYASLAKASPNFRADASLADVAVRAEFRGRANPVVSRSIPSARLPSTRSVVRIAKHGTGTLHYAVAYRYRLALPQAGRYGGIRIERFVREPKAADVLAHFGLAMPGDVAVDAGRVYQIEDRIATDHPLADAIVTDPLPAGFEAVDASFATSNAAVRAIPDSWEIDYQAIYRDRILAFAHHLEAGVYALHYAVRSVTPGTFAWPGADVRERDAPDDFGRTSAGVLTIR